jgi:ABC-type sugar transport system substrate-binding protein
MVTKLGLGAAALCLTVVVAACGGDNSGSSTATTAAAAGTTAATTGSSSSNATTPSSATGGSSAAAAAAAQQRVAPMLQPPQKISVTAPLPSKPKTDVSVYWVTPNLESQQPNTDALEAAATALHWKLTTVQTDSADPQAVPSAMQQAIAGGANYIIVSGGSKAVYGPGLAAAMQAHVPVIDMYSSDDVGGASNGIYANVGGTGWIDVQYPAVADFIIAHSGGDAHVLYVDIPDFPILAAAAKATTAEFAQHCPDCKLTPLNLSVTDLTGGHVTSPIISALQRDSSINYVFTSFGDLATGLPQALKAAGMADRVKIVTATPNADQVQGVIDGSLLAAAPNPKAQGSWTAIDAIARLQEGLPIDQEQHTVMPVVVWTKDNVPTPAGNFAGATNYEDQFKQLWGVS